MTDVFLLKCHLSLLSESYFLGAVGPSVETCLGKVGSGPAQAGHYRVWTGSWRRDLLGTSEVALSKAPNP